MALNSSIDNRVCGPLVDALQLMQHRLSQDGLSRLIVATHTLEELKRQTLPPHLILVEKYRQGPSVAVHGPRQYRNASMVQANWPQDEQHAIIMPTLICVISGQADFHIADYFMQCRVGDMLLIPPGVPQPAGSSSHIADSDESRSCELLWMCPKMAGADGMECWICHSDGHLHEIGRTNEVCWVKNPFLISLFGKLVDEAQHNLGESLNYHFLMSLFLMVQREIEQERVFLPGHHGNRLPEQEFGSVSPDPIESACAYIDSNLNRPLTIELVAQRSCISPATFTRRFREYTGQTFKQYVTAHRLQEAATLLRESDWSVSKIGEFVGLKQSQLRELFHQHYSCSPLEYRKHS